MDSSTLSSNAGSIARLLAGIIGGVMTSKGISVESGSIETIIGAVLIAAAGIWAIVKNVKASKAANTTTAATK